MPTIYSEGYSAIWEMWVNNRSDTIGEPRNAPIAGTVMALRKGDINSSTFCLFSASTMATKV